MNMTAPAYHLPAISMIMLGVRDIEKSVQFYRNRLGLVLKQQFPGFAMFDAGAVTLVLSEDRAKGAASVAGASEVIFSVEDVKAGAQALESQGVEFSHPPHQVNGPMWAANFADPDGHMLTLFGPERNAA
jgi:catechol 2,3-dioxygenase-like lactoylglutathione lyase family enzyme